MQLHGDMFESWRDDLIAHFLGDVDSLAGDHEIEVRVRDRDTGTETTIWHLFASVSYSSLSDDELTEAYDAMVDAMTYPAQVVHSGTTVPSFEEFRDSENAFPSVDIHVITNSATVTGAFDIVVSATTDSEHNHESIPR
jgi:hypothetical protein